MRAKRAIAKLAKLGMEALMLYVALPMAEMFHASKAQWRVADGSNRSAKTLSAAVEYARAHCGCDPYNKYPKTDGRSLAVGLDNDHLALTMFPKVFSSGAGIPFNIIRDEHTRLWRAVRPDPANPMAIDPYDLAYKEKWKAAPPLIPERMIEKIAYEKVNQGVPRLVKMKNGWQGSWRPAGSTAKPPQGAAYDLAWIDEHIDNEGFYTQICRGLMDRSGCAMWSATPERANPELIGLRDRADEGDSRVGRFTFYLDENPYIPPEEKAAFLASLPDDDARRVHYYGDYAVTGRRVYAGEFDPMEKHGYEPEAIPRNHTRYAVVDPGRQWCGNLLASVDPNEKHTRLYDAWIIRKCNGRKWARGLAEHCQGERLEAIVMDRRMGIQKPVGANDDRTTAQYYWEALKEIDWLPRREGPLNGFFPGSDDIPAREEALIGWMQHRDYGPHAGSCRLQIPRGQLRELEDHIKWAQYDNKTGKKRMKLDKGRDELVQCAEYLAAFDPGYHEPESPRIKQENRRAELIDKYEGGTRRGARSGVNVG